MAIEDVRHRHAKLAVSSSEELVKEVALRAVTISTHRTEPLVIYVVAHDPLTGKAWRCRGHNRIDDRVFDREQLLPDVNLIGILQRSFFIGLTVGPGQTIALESIDGAQLAPVS